MPPHCRYGLVYVFEKTIPLGEVQAMKTKDEMWKELKVWLWSQEALSPYDQERALLRSIYRKMEEMEANA